MALGCIFCFILMSANFYLKKEIYRASNVGVDYFLILPKKVLLQN
jgi:hypothetical protein